MSENRGFQLSLLLCYSRITGSSTTSYFASCHLTAIINTN